MVQKDTLSITKAKGRPMLTWVGKKPLEKVEYFPAQEKEIYGDKNSKEFNQLFWGDNLQVLSHLLKEYRGAIDLIYIDPPFDSEADYVKKVKIRGQEIEGEQQNILEEKQYTDMWAKDEYLQFMYDRLLLMKELLSDNGAIYLHCDYRKMHQLRCLLDEVFGEDNFLNSLVWMFSTRSSIKSSWKRTHHDILFYKKLKDPIFNWDDEMVREPLSESTISKYKYEDEIGKYRLNGRFIKDSPIKGAKDVDPKWEESHPEWVVRDYLREGKVASDFFFIEIENQASKNRTEYPTQKPEELLYKLISASTTPGSIILDCFCGSGTTMAVAQKLGRKWIGCDINIGAIQTTTKRLAQIIDSQLKTNGKKLIKDDYKGLLGFKVLNVNDYDIFKNEVEAKEIVIEMYGVEPIKRSVFDGTLDNNFVKVTPLNRVLNKLDIKTILRDIDNNLDSFTVRTTQKQGEDIYEEGVTIICSGAELDVEDYLKKENKTGVKVAFRDILNDKKNLIFKKKPEAKIKIAVKAKNLTVTLEEFYSPILMRKLELENEKVIDKKDQAKVEDFRQIIDSVTIDVDYDGKLFNAEIMDLPEKKEIIQASYSYTYSKAGKYTVAVKIVDVLGEEYFETFNIEA